MPVCRACSEEGDVLGKQYGDICAGCLRAQKVLIDARRRERKRTGEELPVGQACGLCARPMLSPTLDHCHASGRVRAYLCRGCNGRLGHCRDDPEECERRSWLEGAAYLLRHRA